MNVLKSIETKLHKKNHNTYQAYQNIDQVLHDMKEIQENIEKKFCCFQFTCDMTNSVGANVKIGSIINVNICKILGRFKKKWAQR